MTAFTIETILTPVMGLMIGANYNNFDTWRSLIAVNRDQIFRLVVLFSEFILFNATPFLSR